MGRPGPRPSAEQLLHEVLDTLRQLADSVADALAQEQAQEVERDARLSRIQALIREQRFDIAFQPVIDVAQDRLVFYEALARFDAEPQQPPDRWFAQAAELGLLPALERAVMAKALTMLERVPQGVYLSLNVSPVTVLQPDFASLFDGVPLARVMLEVTEHASIPDYEAVARQLQPLRAQGLKLGVDDAGAGFASFRHILQLRPDVIKLDASLIRAIDSRRESRALAASLIRFAEETGARIVAEGVETEAELQVLRELQVDKAQGYLLGRPGPLPVR